MSRKRKTLPSKNPPLPEPNPKRAEHFCCKQSTVEREKLKIPLSINRGLLKLLGEKRFKKMPRSEWQDFKQKLTQDLKAFLEKEGVKLPASEDNFLEQVKKILRQNGQYLMVQFLGLGNGQIRPIVMLHNIERTETRELQNYTPPEILQDDFFKDLADPHQKVRILFLGENVLNRHHKTDFQRTRRGTYKNGEIIVFEYTTKTIARGWAEYLHPYASAKKIKDITEKSTKHSIENIIIPNEASQFYTEKFDVQFIESVSDFFTLSRLRHSDNKEFINFKKIFDWRLKSKLNSYRLTVKIFKEILGELNISENNTEPLNNPEIQEKIVESLFRRLKKMGPKRIKE